MQGEDSYLHLARELPDLAGAGLPAVVAGFLRRNQLEHSDIDHWIVHPGGRRIIENVQSALELSAEDVATSWDALAEHGNVGTPSILYVLKDTIERYEPEPGERGLLVTIGPGRDRRADAARLVAAAHAPLSSAADAHRSDPARQALRAGQAAPRRKRGRPAAPGARRSDGRRRAARARADASRSSSTIVVTGERSVAAAARERGAIVIEDDAESGQPAAATLGVRRALAEGIERVLCVPGDCPTLDPAELDALLDSDARGPRARAGR